MDQVVVQHKQYPRFLELLHDVLTMSIAKQTERLFRITLVLEYKKLIFVKGLDTPQRKHIYITRHKRILLAKLLVNERNLFYWRESLMWYE